MNRGVAGAILHLLKGCCRSFQPDYISLHRAEKSHFGQKSLLPEELCLVLLQKAAGYRRKLRPLSRAMSKSFNQGCIVPPVFTHYFSFFHMENPLLFSKGCPSTGGPPKCTVCKSAQDMEETKGRRKNFFTDKQSYMLLVTTGSKHYSVRRIFFKLTEQLPSIVPSRAWSKHAASAREALFTYTRIDGARQSGSLTKAQWAGALFPHVRINTSTPQSFTATRQSKHQIDCSISERWPKLTDIFHVIPWNNPVLSLAQMWKYGQWRKERLVLERNINRSRS